MGCGVPISPQCRSATDKLGDIARAENWRNPEGVTCVGFFNSLLEKPGHRDRWLECYELVIDFVLLSGAIEV